MKEAETQGYREAGSGHCWLMDGASGQGVCTPAYSVGPGHGQDVGQDGQVWKNIEQAVNGACL